MTITVETGAGITNSNSYVSRADYITYAATVGITIASNDDADVQLIKAQEYIAAHEDNLIGDKVDRDQSISYPRHNLYIEGFSWDSDEIPKQVISCQLAYAIDLNSGEDLYNREANPTQIVTKEKIEGVVEVEYSAPSSNTQKLSKSSTGDALLASLLKTNSFMSIPLVRA